MSYQEFVNLLRNKHNAPIFGITCSRSSQFSSSLTPENRSLFFNFLMFNFLMFNFNLLLLLLFFYRSLLRTEDVRWQTSVQIVAPDRGYCFLCTLGITFGEALSPEKRLHKRLFNDSYYSVDLLPLDNVSSTINVSFGFELIKIVHMVSKLPSDQNYSLLR